ncbi:MAG TPA: hypothetical protein VFF07_06085 [Actinomycetota bacterium]|nr:hypothetical protein [Actinomycetota bacterium]
MRLRTAAAVAALVLVSGVAGVTFLPLASPDEDGGSSPTSGADRQPKRRPTPLSLLYLRGARLHRLNLRSGGDEVLRTLPPAEVHAAPDSAWLALVSAPGATDFAAEPRLSLLHPDSGRRRRIGPGFAPLWRPDGDAVAYLRPVEERSCDAETCAGRVEVVTAGVSGEREILLGPGHWTLLTWAGPRLLLADLDDPGAVTITGGPGPSHRLPLAPAELWGASPDGRWVVVARPREAAFIALSQADELGRRRGLMPGGRLAEGAWSPHSDTVAGVVLQGIEDGVPSSRVVLSSPDGASRALRGSKGAAGAPLWSPDGRVIAFPQAVGKVRDRLRAQVCILESSSCRSWLNWTDEVRLLRLE